MEVPCVHNQGISELMRGIRAHIESLLGEHKTELNAMNLALAHALGRFKVKFNPEKIDQVLIESDRHVVVVLNLPRIAQPDLVDKPAQMGDTAEKGFGTPRVR